MRIMPILELAGPSIALDNDLLRPLAPSVFFELMFSSLTRGPLCPNAASVA